MIRLGDLLDANHLSVDLVACVESRDTWIRWVLNADGVQDADRLRGGELVLSSGRWRTDPNAADRFACALTRHGAAALGISMESPDDLAEMVAACERWRLPLLEIRPPTTRETVSEAAAALIVDRRGALGAESMQRERLFASTTVSGLRSTLDVLQRGMRYPVMLVTRGSVHVPTGGAPPRTSDLRLFAAACRRSAATIEVPLSHAGLVTAFAVNHPAASGGGHAAARLVCACPLAELDENTLALIEQVTLFLGLQMRHADDVRAIRRRGEAALIRRILADEAPASEVEAWVRDLDIQARGEATCLVIRWPGEGAEHLAEFSDALDDLADAVGVPRVFHHDGSQVGMALMVGPDALDRPLEQFRVLIGDQLTRADAHLGTSSTVASSIADVAGAFVSAGQVANLESLRAPRTQVPADRGNPSLAALMLRTDDDARRALVEVLLEPLERYEDGHSVGLIDTLDTFLRLNGHWKEVADEMGIHVNTVRYRIARIEEITGRDLGTIQDRVDFFVALRCREAGE